MKKVQNKVIEFRNWKKLTISLEIRTELIEIQKQMKETNNALEKNKCKEIKCEIKKIN